MAAFTVTKPCVPCLSNTDSLWKDIGLLWYEQVPTLLSHIAMIVCISCKPLLACSWRTHCVCSLNLSWLQLDSTVASRFVSVSSYCPYLWRHFYEHGITLLRFSYIRLIFRNESYLAFPQLNAPTVVKSALLFILASPDWLYSFLCPMLYKPLVSYCCCTSVIAVAAVVLAEGGTMSLSSKA